jgi:hypothetical protein
MTLPFQKLKEGSFSMPSDSIKREPDSKEVDVEPTLLDACAEDMLTAIAAKDKEMLKEVLQAFAEHILEIDAQLDAPE